jgi:PhnB protein
MHIHNHGVPDGYHSVTPYLAAPSADALIAFLVSAFDARVVQRVEREGGGVAHAEVEIGDSRVMICDATAQHAASPAVLYLYVADADDGYGRAMAAGAHSIAEPADMPYGDRHGGVTDPAGNQWWIATRLASSAEPVP